MQSPLKILFVDDHVGLRDGMMYMLQSKNPAFQITGVGTAAEALRTLSEEADFRVVILDLNLDGDLSLSAIPKIKAAGAGILVYTMYNDALHVQNALRAGVQGFVTKEAPVEELCEAIIAVSRGSTYYNSVASAVLSSLLPANKGRHFVQDEKSYVFDNYNGLSQKEREVFICIAQGLDTAEIAKRLGKSQKTILNQRTSVYDKMMIKDRHELIEKAKLLGVIF